MKPIELSESVVFPEAIMIEDEQGGSLHAVGNLVNDLKPANDWCLEASSFLSL